MILNDHLEDKGLAFYKLGKKQAGSTEMIRKQSSNKVEHFELYSSIVHAHVDGSGQANLEMDIHIYEE